MHITFFHFTWTHYLFKSKKGGSNTNVQILGHKKPLREAQISEKMHKKFYMMVIKLLLRFLKHKMVKLKPNKKRGENMRSVVENLNFSGILQKIINQKECIYFFCKTLALVIILHLRRLCILDYLIFYVFARFYILYVI